MIIDELKERKESTFFRFLFILTVWFFLVDVVDSPRLKSIPLNEVILLNKKGNIFGKPDLSFSGGLQTLFGSTACLCPHGKHHPL